MARRRGTGFVCIYAMAAIKAAVCSNYEEMKKKQKQKQKNSPTFEISASGNASVPKLK
jgi:hypothetical protein